MRSTLLAFILFIFIAPALHAQQIVEWNKAFGGEAGEIFPIIQQTSDGGYILGGTSESKISGEKTQPSRGQSDYWIVKIAANGSKQWDKTFGGSSSEQLTSLLPTSDGGYLLGGFSNSGAGGDKSEDVMGSNDFWVVKINASGTKQWDKTYGGSGADLLRSLNENKDGSYILGGSSDSGISGNKTQASQREDMWLLKINPNGNVIWDKTIGGKDNDGLIHVQQTPDLGYILAGSSNSNSSGSKTSDSKGGTDYWVVKLASNGSIVWDKSIGSAGEDYLSFMELTRDGGFILAGNSASGISMDKTEASRGDMDYWVVKLAANGTVTWDKTLGGSSYEECHAVKQTASGEFLVGGYSASTVSGDKSSASRGDDDYWIVKLAANGSKVWDKGIGSQGIDRLNSMTYTSDDGLVLAGNTDGGISGDKTQTSRGQDDFWIVKLNKEAQPQTLFEVPVLADAFIRDGGFSNVNFSQGPGIEIKNGIGNSIIREAYQKFSLAGIPQVASAKLRIFGKNVESDNYVNVSAYAVTNDNWKEAEILWINAPASSRTLLGSTAVNKVPLYYEIDVTSFVKAQFAGDKIVSLALKNASAKNRKLVFNSKESRVNPPQLLISTVPTSAARLMAESGNAVEDTLTTYSSIYPNPVKDKFTLELDSRHGSEAVLELINSTGIVYPIKTRTKGGKGISTEVDLSGLPLKTGMHLLRIKSEFSSEIIKVLVVQ